MMSTMDIFDAHRHVTALSQTLGLMPVVGRSWRAAAAYRAWTLVLISLYGYLFYVASFQREWRRRDDVNWLNCMIYRIRTMLRAAMLLVLMDIGPVLSRRWNFLDLLSDLRKVDTSLAALTMDVAYGREKRKINAYFYTTLIGSAAYAALNTYLSGDRDLIEEASGLTTLFMHLIVQLQFSTVILSIAGRFGALNRWLEFHGSSDATTAKIQQGERHFCWVSPGGARVPQLAIVGRIHTALRTTAAKAERAYAFRLLLIISHCFVFVTLKTYYVCSSAYAPRTADKVVSSLLAIIFDLVQILNILYATATTMAECKRTGVLLHRLEHNQSSDPHRKQEIVLLSLQVLHGRLNFTACGLFRLDYSLIQSIIGAVTTYLIIIVQFDITGQSKQVQNNGTSVN